MEKLTFGEDRFITSNNDEIPVNAFLNNTSQTVSLNDAEVEIVGKYTPEE